MPKAKKKKDRVPMNFRVPRKLKEKFEEACAYDDVTATYELIQAMKRKVWNVYQKDRVRKAAKRAPL